MSNLEDLLITAQRSKAEAARLRKQAHDEVTAIMDGATRAGRSNLTADEDSRVTALFRTRDASRADEAAAQDRISRIEAIAEEEREAQRQARNTRPSGAELPGRDSSRMVIGSERRTYSRDNNDRQCTGHQFLLDVSRSMLGIDPQATQRLADHMREEAVERPMQQRAVGDTTTANWAGLTVPQYLTDFYAPAVSTHRPLADMCTPHQLPPLGMSINISRVTTPTAISIQTTELQPGGEQSADDTLLTIPVQTALGDQTISRQAVDRGTGIEDVVMQDLFSRYAAQLDSTLVNQAVTGLSAAAATTAFTSGSPTVPLMYPLVLQTQAAVETALLGIPVTHVLMTSSRWAWMSAHLGATYPLINNTGIPPFSGGSSYPDSAYNAGIRGVLPNGLKVVTDNNIPVNLGAGTNQDEVYVVPQAECHLWEEPNAPLYIRAEQTKAAQLGVLIVVYSYFGYTFSRYANGMGKLSGTGLTTPVFTTA